MCAVPEQLTALVVALQAHAQDTAAEAAQGVEVETRGSDCYLLIARICYVYFSMRFLYRSIHRCHFIFVPVRFSLTSQKMDDISAETGFYEQSSVLGRSSSRGYEA